MLTIKESAQYEESIIATFRSSREKEVARNFMKSVKSAIARMFNSYPFYGGKGSGKLTRKEAESSFYSSQYGAQMREIERDIIGVGPYGKGMPPALDAWWDEQWDNAWKKIESEYRFKK